jgi:transcriptional regulatory protein LevR
MGTAMDNSLHERLDLLTLSEQITEQAKEMTVKAMGIVEDTYRISLDEDNAAAFVTHFAVACTRIERGEPVTSYRANIAEAVEQFPELHQHAGALFQGLSREVPEAEVGFITMYLCALLDKEV